MQFQELTNKFEQINFKIDKLSNELSKVQQDNQLRFEQIEQNSILKMIIIPHFITKMMKLLKPGNKTKNILPGSSSLNL